MFYLFIDSFFMLSKYCVLEIESVTHTIESSWHHWFVSFIHEEKRSCNFFPQRSLVLEQYEQYVTLNQSSVAEQSSRSPLKSDTPIYVDVNELHMWLHSKHGPKTERRNMASSLACLLADVGMSLSEICTFICSTSWVALLRLTS